jgi:predicted secreted protein
MVREFLKNRYRLCCFIGLENSPTCGIHWGRHKVNRYGTESPNSEEGYEKNPKDPVLRGIMAEILEEELAKEGITTPFLELPALSPADSDKRQQFWKDLEDALSLIPE